MTDLESEVNQDEQELFGIFIHQKECFAQQPFADYSQRKKALDALYNIIINNKDRIIESIDQDFGCRPRHETEVLEIFPSIEAIKYIQKNLKSWMKPQKHKVSKWFWPSSCWVQAQAKGVIGIVTSWNYPLFLAIAPLAAALAAGNRVMIKLSEQTPKTSKLLSDLLSKPFLPSKLAVITGDAKVAKEFTELAFDHLLFTGTTEVGKKVMQAASSNLTPVTLELGGKSPAVLLHNEINNEFIEKIWQGKLINAGQTCIAPDYILLPRGDNDRLLEISQRVVKTKFDNIDNKNYCSIINKNNYLRIIELVNDAIDKGAKWYPIVEKWHIEHNNIYKIAPGLLLDANHTMNIMQQEIFGPVLPAMQYDTFDQLLTMMQITPRPLAMYLFTNDNLKQKRFINNTVSGSLCINNTVVQAAQESLPFGGIGTSGMGCYRGKYGFDTFSMLKPVYKQSKLDIFSKFYPPTKPWQKALLNYMIK